MKSIRKFIIKTSPFVLSNHFPILLAIVLIFSGLLDTGTTAYILRTNPELFHANEGGLLAKHFLDTNFFWIALLGYALTDSVILLLGYFCNPKNSVFIKICSKIIRAIDNGKMDSHSINEISYVLRIQCLCYASFGTLFAIGWMI